jgi:hypothetical protein
MRGAKGSALELKHGIAMTGIEHILLTVLVIDLFVAPQAAHWQHLKRLVLDSVSSPITRRVYNLRLNEFFEWPEPRPGDGEPLACSAGGPRAG